MIAILNYGLGNIRAFANIYRDLDIPFAIVEDRETLMRADKIILPGVGAFDHAMRRLKASGMAETLSECVLGAKVPVLGVCVGMQMLAEASEEGGEPGLGWIGGTVRKIRFTGDTPGLLPHMGWNTVTPRAGEPLLAGFDDAFGFYFLHSYVFDCADRANVIAEANYAGAFACAVRSANVHGVQFHPEKSHRNGVRLLKNFAEL